MTRAREAFQAVFLDRDGVLNVHVRNGYVTSPDDLELLPGVAQAVRRINDADIPAILISNQQGVGKGLMTQGDLDAVSAALAEKLDFEAGAFLTKSYYCTHLKDEDCACRKPKAGMLLQAAEDLNLDLARTVFVGDSPTDIQAGAAAGVGRRILVLSGGSKGYDPETFPAMPDYVFQALPSVVNWLQV